MLIGVMLPKSKKRSSTVAPGACKTRRTTSSVPTPDIHPSTSSSGRSQAVDSDASTPLTRGDIPALVKEVVNSLRSSEVNPGVSRNEDPSTQETDEHNPTAIPGIFKTKHCVI